MGKLNFRIVESSTGDKEYEDIFEDFKVDYLNPFTSKKELIEKYDLPKRIYEKFINRIFESESITKKPIRRPLDNDMRYIYRLKHRWGIRKAFGRNAFVKYYGYYNDLDIAKMVRDKLYYSDWNDDVAEVLIAKYSIGKSNPTDPLIEEKYDEFKDMYMNQPLYQYEIREKLGISSHLYGKLLHKLREEIPNVKKYNVFEMHNKPNRFIYKDKTGYYVQRCVNGRTQYFGHYKRLEDAFNRRNWLETHDWGR